MFKGEKREQVTYVGTTSSGVSTSTLRHTRRLSDKLFTAFHQACDTVDLDVAEQLLEILEKMMSKRHTINGGSRRRNMEDLVAAFERLWHLRHPKF